MFPAAGHMALAIEGAMQHCEIKKIDVSGMTLRKVELKTALIIPETDAGVEIQLRLSVVPASLESAPSYTFSVESCANKTWTVHSEGTVVPVIATHGFLSPSTHPVNLDVLTQRHTGKRWNSAFKRVGFEYGPSFDTLNNIKTHEKYFQAAGQIPITTTSTAMADESRYMLHPSTVDCLLQLSIIAIHAGLYEEMPWGVVPIKLEEVTFFPPGEDANTIGQAVAWNSIRGERSRYFNTSSQLATPAGKVILDMKGLHLVAYEAALPPRSDSEMKPLPYAGVVWKPDLATCSLKDALSVSSKTNSAVGAVLEIVDLWSHKQPLSSVLVMDSEDFPIGQVTQSFSATTNLHYVQAASEMAKDSPSPEERRVTRYALPEGPLDLKSLSLKAQDMIIIGRKEAPILVKSELWSSLNLILDARGKVLFLLNNDDLPQAQEKVRKSGFSSTEINFQDQTVVICSPAPAMNGDAHEPETVNLVYSRRHSAVPQALADAMADQGLNIHVKEMEEVNLVTDKQILLYDPSGNLLARPESVSFEIMKEILSSGRSVLWLTAGVHEGKCASGAMVQGFLRVAREEQKMSKLFLLDMNESETFASVAKTVATILVPSTNTASSAEHEYWLRNGVCHVNRVIPNKDINDRMITTEEAAQDMPLPSQGSFRAVFDGSNIAFKRNDELESLLIGPTEVELQVEYIEFSKQDLHAEIEEPRLVSGLIIDVGETVDSRLRGRTVVAYESNPYDTVVRVAEEMCVECEPSVAKGLVYALPEFCQAVNALQCIAGPMEKQHIILLPTSESMALSFAKLSGLQGFKLTVVRNRRANPETKTEGFLLNAQSAFDISDVSQILRLVDQANSPTAIIADNFSPDSQEIWRRIPSDACFVIHGKKRISLPAAPEVDSFNRGARFCVTSIVSNFEKDPKSLGKTLRIAVSAIKDQARNLINVPSVVTIDSFKEAPGGATDTCVLRYNYGKDLVKV